HRMRYTVATWAMVSDPGRNAASIRVRPAAARNPNCNVPLVPWHAVIRLLPYLRLQSAARRVGYGFEERLQGSDRMPDLLAACHAQAACGCKRRADRMPLLPLALSARTAGS